MGTSSSSDIAWQMMKPFFTNPKTIETAEQAASRKGAVLGSDDATFAETVADNGIQEARKQKKGEESTDSYNKEIHRKFIATVQEPQKTFVTLKEKHPEIDQRGKLLALNGLKTINPGA